jgi:BirA family transcriptional regulator, biotin operon repressor / biotin---[acetyl-CoA-carboxylase] ligase
MFNVTKFELSRRGKFGTNLYYFESLESTNTIAEQLARQNAAEGTLVLANKQTGGKGRNSRVWYSPADCNLYVSIIVRPPGAKLHFLPFLAGIALVRTLGYLGLTADLKWPNDILVSDKKVSGILIQSAFEQNALKSAIVGIGINVNLTEFPPPLEKSATSLSQELGYAIDRELLLASFLLEFESVYEKMNSASWQDLKSEIEQHSSILHNCVVSVNENGKLFEGETAGLDSYGGLILQMGPERKVIYAGDVISCRKK